MKAYGTIKPGGIKQRVASKLAGGHYRPANTIEGGALQGGPARGNIHGAMTIHGGAIKPGSVAPVAGTPLGSSVSPVTPPDPGANDPAMPDPKDSTYVAGIAGDMSTRGRLTAQYATAFANNTAGAQNAGNKAGLLHSSTLANQLADLSTGYGNDLRDLYSQYGNPADVNDHGTHGTQLLGEAQQRHLGDPAPTVVDDKTVRAMGGVGLASGWRILYDASGKPVRFLKPGEKYNGQ